MWKTSKNYNRFLKVKDIGSVQMGWDLRLGILMQMEKKWSAELW
jgi:hypothetical protein